MKAFLYLDEYKMYSLSSQMFEGLTEYVIDTDTKILQEGEQQKGKIGSGRIMADILKTEKISQSKKFLHDFAYTLFEDAIFKERNCLRINQNNIDEKIKLIEESSFVHVTGKIVFNDARLIANTFENFNSFGGALGYLQYKEIAEQEQAIKEQIKNVKGRNQKVVAKKKFDKNYFKSFLLENGLNLEDKYIEEMVKVINFGYNGQFETQMPFVTGELGILFNSIINRQYLRETEESLIAKYSRETEIDLCMFGLLTQATTKDPKNKIKELSDFLNNNNEELDEEGNPKSLGMKHAIMGIVNAIMNLENTFIGKANYEYIIDPISIYRQI